MFAGSNAQRKSCIVSRSTDENILAIEADLEHVADSQSGPYFERPDASEHLAKLRPGNDAVLDVVVR